MSKLTVKDLFDKKGKVKLTELYVTNALEAFAAEQASGFAIYVGPCISSLFFLLLKKAAKTFFVLIVAAKDNVPPV